MFEHSEHLDQLAGALSRAQGAFRAVPKGKTARVQMKSGGEYSYKYADLADAWDIARVPLNENGLSVIQSPGQFERGVLSVTTMLLHTSGQWVRSTLAIDARDATPQGMGTAITYARRYGLAAVIGLVTDDDTDAQDHQPPHREPRPAREPQQRQNGNGRHTQPPVATEREQLVEALRMAYSEAKRAGANVTPPGKEEVAGWSDEMVRQALGVFRAAKLEAEQKRQTASVADEAEQRFFDAHTETIGGRSWQAAQRYLGQLLPKPKSPAEWDAASREIRDRARGAEYDELDKAVTGAGK